MKRPLGMRIRGLVAVCGLTVALSSAVAVPPVLQRVPDDAMVTLIIPSPQTLHKNLTAMAAAIESPIPVPTVEDLLAMAGIMGGVDLTKPIAIVALGPKDKPKAAAKDDAKDAGKDASKSEKDQKGAKKAIVIDGEEVDVAENAERMLVLVPVTKYEEFLGNFGAKPAGEGKVDEFATNDDRDMFSKSIGGGYIVMGEQKELVEAFTGKAGDKPISSRLSKAGEALSDSADVVTIVNMDRVRPYAEMALNEMERQAKKQMEQLAREGQDKNLAVMKWMGDTIVRDTQMFVGGVKVGSMGVSMDMVGAFKPDSYLAKAVSGKGNASALLGKLPGGPYLWAGALDLSTPGMKTLMKDITGKMELPGGAQAAKSYTTMVENLDGQGVVMGFPMGGAFAGLLTSTVICNSSKDPSAVMKAFKDGLVAMNGQKVEEMTYVTKFVENASKSGDTPIHAWETKIEAADGDQLPAQMAQAMPLLFGPQGMPLGYVAQGEGAVYVTYAKNTDLMTKALGAAKGDNLAADSNLRQAQDLLPKDRIAEMYVGTRSILDLLLPLAQMGGVSVPVDKIPEKLPPVAAAISAQEGAVRMSIVIPMPVLKTGVSLALEVNQAIDDAGGAAPAKPEKGAGQPKF